MARKHTKEQQRKRRHARVRARIFGTKQIPRLSVYRSLQHVYAQLIDDEHSVTLVAARDQELSKKVDSKTQVAFQVGELLAQKAKKAGISRAVFDKGSFKYHGRVRELAEGARHGGLTF